MMTLNLWLAEWLKTRKRPINLGMLAIMLVIILVLFAGTTGVALYNGGDFVDRAASVLPFPRSLQVGIDLLGNIGPLLVVVFVASNVGSEYGRDTWKVILPRYGSRIAFLLTKWAVGLATMLLLIACVCICAMVFGWLGSLSLGISGDPAPGPDTAELLRSMAVMVFYFAFIATLTLLGTVATRSTIGGAVVGLLAATIILPVLGSALSLLVTGAPIILPTEHLNNLRAQWVAQNPEATAYMTALFNRSVPPLASALVVLGYIVVMLGGSLYLFKRRDMAGE
jgi:ABC-type transport system involved in multi-copper enzyme maturation permease subunit